MAKQSRAGGPQVRRVLREYKEGKLKSSSGRKVRSRKQAIAIALSEARAVGATIPTPSRGGRKRSSPR